MWPLVFFTRDGFVRGRFVLILDRASSAAWYRLLQARSTSPSLFRTPRAPLEAQRFRFRGSPLLLRLQVGLVLRRFLFRRSRFFQRLRALMVPLLSRFRKSLLPLLRPARQHRDRLRPFAPMTRSLLSPPVQPPRLRLQFLEYGFFLLQHLRRAQARHLFLRSEWLLQRLRLPRPTVSRLRTFLLLRSLQAPQLRLPSRFQRSRFSLLLPAQRQVHQYPRSSSRRMPPSSRLWPLGRLLRRSHFPRSRWPLLGLQVRQAQGRFPFQGFGSLQPLQARLALGLSLFRRSQLLLPHLQPRPLRRFLSFVSATPLSLQRQAPREALHSRFRRSRFFPQLGVRQALHRYRSRRSPWPLGALLRLRAALSRVSVRMTRLPFLRGLLRLQHPARFPRFVSFPHRAQAPLPGLRQFQRSGSLRQPESPMRALLFLVSRRRLVERLLLQQHRRPPLRRLRSQGSPWPPVLRVRQARDLFLFQGSGLLQHRRSRTQALRFLRSRQLQIARSSRLRLRRLLPALRHFRSSPFSQARPAERRLLLYRLDGWTTLSLPLPQAQTQAHRPPLSRFGFYLVQPQGQAPASRPYRKSGSSPVLPMRARTLRLLGSPLPLLAVPPSSLSQRRLPRVLESPLSRSGSFLGLLPRRHLHLRLRAMRSPSGRCLHLSWPTATWATSRTDRSRSATSSTPSSKPAGISLTR